MLTRLVNISRVLSRVPKAGYNVYGQAFGGLDPSKHTYMNKAFQNQYEDFFRLGDYPFAEDFPQMIDSMEYLPSYTKIIEEHLKERFPQNTFTADGFLNGNLWAAKWTDLGVTDINAELPALFFKLSEKIIIKQSKMTWTKEQRYRLKASQETLAGLNFNSAIIGEFLIAYNTLVWMMVRQTHLWSAPSIRGAKSPIELKIEEESQPLPQIKSLYKDRPENNNFINRLLKLVHQ